MKSSHLPRLDKILALADSTFESEAVIAVRKARQILSTDGLRFSDLAKAALFQQKPFLTRYLTFFTDTDQTVLENNELKHRIQELEASLLEERCTKESYRQEIRLLEQKLAQAVTHSERWRELARDTVQKLWDLGQSLPRDEAYLYNENTTEKTA